MSRNHSKSGNLNNVCNYQWPLTLIATGYITPPTSKLPFLNIITEVLFIHVPKSNEQSKVNMSITNIDVIKRLKEAIGR